MKEIACILKKTFSIVLIFCFLVPPVLAADDSGTFRGKWWNYYDRAVEKAELGKWQEAVTDLLKALSLREKDQRMARTYGMHFVDYFPHRELGVAYLSLGDIDRASAELEESIKSEGSAKAFFYLNRVRKAIMIRQKQTGLKPPAIALNAPAENSATKDESIVIRGSVSGECLVAKLTVNSHAVDIELAAKQMTFEQAVSLADGENRILVRAEDLMGNISDKTLLVIVDRQGPSIVITGVNTEVQDGKKIARIMGEVEDGTGIQSIVINEQDVKAGKRKNQSFDLTVPVDLKGMVSIRAVDTLGNETNADINVDREVAVFQRKEPWVQLAFNGPGILSSDKELPEIKLKDPTDIPLVFLNSYYIDGEVSDNKSVEKILINGKEVSSKNGRKVFFSKMLTLSEGRNRILVEAIDSSGNKAVSEFTITKHVPSVLQNGARMSLSLLPFDTKKSTDLMTLAYDYLAGAFTDQKRFNMIERSKLEQVMVEQKLTKAKLTDPEHSIRIGRLMSAEAIVATTVREDQKSIEIVSRVINTETSQVMEVRDVFTEDKSAPSVKELMAGLAAKIAVAFPLVEGIVINKDKGYIYTDIGNKVKIHKDAAVIVYRRGKELKHPVTGKSLGFDTIKLAEGRFEEIREDFSKAKILDKPSPQEIVVKDLIVTK